MTDAEPGEMITVTSDAVTVEKSFEPDDFPVPAIAFTIRSDRDTDVSVRLVDTVPDDVVPENIGFHPKYGAEFWEIEDGKIVFRRDLSAGEEYTTVYGLRGGDADTAAKFMSEPTLESVEPPLSSEEVDSALEAAAVDGVGGPETIEAELSGSDDGEDGNEGEVVGVDSEVAAEPAEAISESFVDRVPEDGDTEDESSNPADDLSNADDRAVSSLVDDRSVVGALADEIRDGEIDDEDLMVLRDALGLDLASATVEARIEHLQSSLADLEAYTDALEAFLDEEGDAQALLSETKNKYQEADGRIDELERQVAELRSSLDDRPEEIESVIDERVDPELEGVRSELESISRRLDDESESREEIRSDLEDVSAELADVAEMRDRLTNALGGLGGTASPDGDDETDSGAEDSNEEDEQGSRSSKTEVTSDDSETDQPDDADEGEAESPEERSDDADPTGTD